MIQGRCKTFLFSLAILLVHCQSADERRDTSGDLTGDTASTEKPVEDLLAKYTTFRLTADLGNLTDAQKEMIGLLIEAGKQMDACFWREAFGEKARLMEMIDDEKTRRFAEINYGPWDRLAGNAPFIESAGEKPKGANFYPKDMSKEEFEASSLSDKASLYTMIRRDADGQLTSVPYHEFFREEHQRASELLDKASELAENKGLKKYLKLRSKALLDDAYQESDMAWLDMKTNQIDVVIGPIETYEDQLFGYKAAHECYVLIKDMDWSARLEKYAQFLPELQENLPVEARYKAEKPGRDTELNAYDVVYYSGDCNAGSKTIAINLPNDEEVQLKKGTRRLQLKNAMQAKFDKILLPISKNLITPQQRRHITFDAFFANTMFHEVAHGLGIKNTIDGSGTVRKALREHASAIEEGKADILGLYMIRQLHKKGEIEGDLMDYYVTFMTSIFRSVRFGASSAHGKANMIRFNYFKEAGAFERNADTGLYTVNRQKLEEATESLSRLILTLQGNGDYAGAAELIAKRGITGPQLRADLDMLSDRNIPVDIVFEQGREYLDL